MTDIYTKAEAFAVNTTLDKQADAIYLGHGYSTDDTTASDLGSPNLWWKADEGITKGGSGTVSQWTEANGTGVNLTSTVGSLLIDAASAGPTWTAGDATSNYKDFLSFTVAGKTFLTAAANAQLDQGTGDFTVIMFVRFDDATANRVAMAKDYNNSSWVLRTKLTGEWIATVSGADASTDAVLEDMVWYCLEWSHNGTTDSSQMYINGVADGSAASAAFDFDDDEAFLVGCRNNATEQYQEMDVGEILYYNDSQLTAAERIAVNDYCDEKYRASTKAKVTYFTDQDAVDASVSVEIADLKIGEVHPITAIRIAGGAATNAANIVALYKD
jgi:hypothetical protein